MENTVNTGAGQNAPTQLRMAPPETSNNGENYIQVGNGRVQEQEENVESPNEDTATEEVIPESPGEQEEEVESANEDTATGQEVIPELHGEERYVNVRESLQHSGLLSVTDFNYRPYRRFSAYGLETTVDIPEQPESVNALMWLETVVREIHRIFTLGGEPEDQIGMELFTDKLNHSLWITFQKIKDFNVDDVWNVIFKVAQSSRAFEITEPIRIKVDYVKMPIGAGRVLLDCEEANKRSIKKVKMDNLCLPRAIVVGIAAAHNEHSDIVAWKEVYQKLRRDHSALQKKWALDLVKEANVTVLREGCRVEELQAFQRVLARDGIVMKVYKFAEFARERPPFFDGTDMVLELTGSCGTIDINLFYYEPVPAKELPGHYRACTSLTAALCKQYCENCHRGVTNLLTHRCSKKCKRCLSPTCSEVATQSVKCEVCDRLFFGVDCLRNHKVPGSYVRHQNISVCDALKYCNLCTKIYRRFDIRKKDFPIIEHECNSESMCFTCDEKKLPNHLCYIAQKKMTQKSEKLQDNSLFFFYDFETRQEKSITDASGKEVFEHEPNLCVVQKACNTCMHDNDLTKDCKNCGKREYVFKENPVKQLVDLVVPQKTTFTQINVIAHNSRSFDGQFVLQYLMTKLSKLEPELILNGTKVTCIKIKKTRFIDSLSYFNMPLSALPKAFGLTEGISKGYFPHFFNVQANQNYRGPIPEAKYYGVETMKEKNYNEFMEWYNEMVAQSYVFDFQSEFLKYCKMDVTILRQACIAFRTLFLRLGNVCPFAEAMTIASACSLLFRRNFLKKDSIAVLPKNGYRASGTFSRKSIEWLLYIEKNLERKICHAGRQKEVRLPEGYLVDGFDPVDNTVYQYHGCFWHGCPCKKKNRDEILKDGTSLDSRLERTEIISKAIRDAGYQLIEIFECNFDRQIREDITIRQFLKTKRETIDMQPLNPRDSFFGGRTGMTKTLHVCNENETISYIDICSLYPYVCKTGKYILGHPEIFLGHEECLSFVGGDLQDLSKVEGLVKCDVLPPRDLYHPVLPYRMHNRLLFPLCRKCAEDMCQNDCTHEEIKDRIISGTWVVDELRKAISKGYKITKIHEIWQYETTQYDPVTDEGGLFPLFVKVFSKYKTQASGFPKGIVTLEQKLKFISDFAEAEGVNLDMDEIMSNPALRAICKLILNCFWGKFGQRENMTKNEIIRDPKRLYELLTDPSIEIKGYLPINDEKIHVSWAHLNEASVPSKITNVVIAAYTTCQARLILYDYLEKLDRRVLYFDTDSVIFVTDKTRDTYIPPTGNYLGQMTDELVEYGEGARVSEFASLAPKVYGILVQLPGGGEPKEMVKVKGISLNRSTADLINFKTLKEFALAERTEPVRIDYTAIRRTKVHKVITKAESKLFKPVKVKRRFLDNFDSLPYGYKN